MKKGLIINGYTILKDFTTAGGGLSKWTFARKSGEDFFFKEFLSPTYPVAGSPGSSKTKENKLQRCLLFEQHQQSLMKAVSSKCAATGGNLIFARDFFREGTKYYKVTEKIDVASLTTGDIAKLPLDSRVLIMKTVAHSVRILHQLDIVHGDLKPFNILIKHVSKANYIAKLIDFDNSFFSGRPQKSEELVGDLVFYSPEFAKFVSKDPTVTEADLKISSDIFALGIVFCLYLTAELPEFNHDKYSHPWHAANNGQRLSLKTTTDCPEALTTLVNSMLQARHEARPTIGEVFEALKAPSFGLIKPSPSSSSETTSLKGTLAKRIRPEEVPSVEKLSEPKPSVEESKPGAGKLRGKLIK